MLATNQGSSANVLLYKIPEVVQILNISRTTVYVAIRRGELGSVKIGWARRVTRAQLEAYAEDLERRTA